MQREKCVARRRLDRSEHSRTSKQRVVNPIEPPPPPLFGGVEVGGGVGGVGVGVPGVGPDVIGAAQGVLPAVAGAAVLARSDSTWMSAVSVRFWLSVTVRRSVIDPELGAMTVAAEVFAPTTAGGLIDGAMTIHE
jgi:hypothetical protein